WVIRFGTRSDLWQRTRVLSLARGRSRQGILRGLAEADLFLLAWFCRGLSGRLFLLVRCCWRCRRLPCSLLGSGRSWRCCLGCGWWWRRSGFLTIVCRLTEAGALDLLLLFR